LYLIENLTGVSVNYWIIFYQLLGEFISYKLTIEISIQLEVKWKTRIKIEKSLIIEVIL